MTTRATYIRRPTTMSKADFRASKYCFSARCPLRPNTMSTATVAMVFGFDPKPSIGRDVDQVAKIFGEETGYIPGDTEILFHEECPTEIQNEVYVSVFAEPIDGSDVTMDEVHAMAIKQQLQITKPSTLRGYDEDDEDDRPPPAGGGPRRPPPPPPKGGDGGGGGGNVRRRPRMPSGDSGILCCL